MKRILIVDDQKMIRKLVNMSLSEQGFEIIEAENGEQAVQLINKESPDLVILDIMMPGEVDGLGVCHIIKNTDELKHIVVLFLTAKGQKIDLEEGKEAGADDYLLKPFSPQNLLTKVKQHLS